MNITQCCMVPALNVRPNASGSSQIGDCPHCGTEGAYLQGTSNSKVSIDYTVIGVSEQYTYVAFPGYDYLRMSRPSDIEVPHRESEFVAELVVGDEVIIKYLFTLDPQSNEWVGRASYNKDVIAGLRLTAIVCDNFCCGY